MIKGSTLDIICLKKVNLVTCIKNIFSFLEFRICCGVTLTPTKHLQIIVLVHRFQKKAFRLGILRASYKYYVRNVLNT